MSASRGVCQHLVVESALPAMRTVVHEQELADRPMVLSVHPLSDQIHLGLAPTALYDRV